MLRRCRRERAAVRAGQDVGADGAGNRRLGTEPILRRFIEQRERADNDRLQRRGLTIIGHIDPLAGLFVLLRSSEEGEPFDVNERAGDL